MSRRATYPGILPQEIRQAPAGLNEARSAWERRDLILSPNGLRGKPKLLLGIARRQIREGLTVKQAARAMELSARQLERLSRKTFGVSPKILLKLGRMRTVLKALIVKEGSLTQIAEQTGFPDQASLSRFVNKFMGVRPGAYRRARSRDLKHVAF